MPNTIHGAATIRSLQVIRAAKLLPLLGCQCTWQACQPGEGAMVMM